MPCHAARARQLLRQGKAIKRHDRGIVYLQLTERTSGATQPIAVGIDPGSKKEAYTVQSHSHTLLNIQADAVTWVKIHTTTRRQMRRARRYRKTPLPGQPQESGTWRHPTIHPRPMGLESTNCTLAGPLLPDHYDCG